MVKTKKILKIAFAFITKSNLKLNKVTHVVIALAEKTKFSEIFNFSVCHFPQGTIVNSSLWNSKDGERMEANWYSPIKGQKKGSRGKKAFAHIFTRTSSQVHKRILYSRNEYARTRDYRYRTANVTLCVLHTAPFHLL